MQRFTAKQVIEAARSGRYLTPESRNDRKAFSLITADEVNLSLADLDAVDDLIRYIEEGYKVRLRIIGGGAYVHGAHRSDAGSRQTYFSHEYVRYAQ